MIRGALVSRVWDVSDVALADTVVVDEPPTDDEEPATGLHVRAVTTRRPGPSATYLARIGAAGRAMRGLS